MKISTLKYIFKQFGYPVDKWTPVPEISRIGLGDDVKIYIEDSGKLRTEIYLDTTYNILLQRTVEYSKDHTEVYRINTIIDINEVTTFETLNTYSETIFTGQRQIKR